MLLGFGTGGSVLMVSMILADGSEWLKLLFSGLWGPLVGLNEDRGLSVCLCRQLPVLHVRLWLEEIFESGAGQAGFYF